MRLYHTFGRVEADDVSVLFLELVRENILTADQMLLMLRTIC